MTGQRLAQDRIELEATADDQCNDKKAREHASTYFCRGTQGLSLKGKQKINGNRHKCQDHEGQSGFRHGYSLVKVGYV